MDRLKKIRENIHKFVGIFNLYRLKDGAVIGGVCKMIAEKFVLKVILVRILFVMVSIFSLGLGAVFYGFLVWILPKKEKVEKDYIDVEFKEKTIRKEIE